MLKALEKLYWNFRLPQTKVKLFLSDVDGVLTDGGMYYTESGDEFKKFQVQDGMGFVLLHEKGIQTGLITAEDRQLNQRRVDKLKLNHYYPGEKDKLTRVKKICADLKINLSDVSFIGDDINDLEILSHVGFRACPANARPQIKAIPGIKIMKSKGGEGAVRDWMDFLAGLGRI